MTSTPWHDHPAEVEVLLSCAKPRACSGNGQPNRGPLPQALEWDGLLAAAADHGITPLLYHQSAAAGAPTAPAPVQRRLRDHHNRNARRSLRLTRELLNLVSLFKTNAISAVPFKGPVLAAAVYGDLALRQFLDLDVLVHRHDVPRATDLLLSTGYRPQFRLTDSQEAHLLRHDCERAFARDDGTIVELHWDLTPRYFPFIRDPDRLWDRLEPFALGGATVRTLAPDDLLLFLCVHGGKHLWDRLRWIRDVAELLRRRPEIDGAALVVRARALGVERMLLLGLLLASEVLDAPVAEELRRRARADRTVTALAAQVSGRLWRHTPGTPNDPWELRLFHLRLRERWRDRLRYCASVVFTPAPVDWTLVRLPDALYFLYYLIRPVRLAVKHSVRLLRALTAHALFRTAPPQFG